VLVRAQFAGVLPYDWKMRKGWFHQVFPIQFPYIPGVAVSGTIESVGTGVTSIQEGQSVFGKARGAYAEYVIIPIEDLVPMPDMLTYEDAAAITGGAATAWKALFNEGNLQSGQRVLIHAAAGGVGQFAVQLAKWKGAEVIGTVSTANTEFVRSLGADQVIDYTNSSFEDAVKDVDLVLDAIGGETQDRSWSIIKRGGTLVSLVQPPSEEKANELGIRAKFNTTVPTYDNLQTLAQLIADGIIKAEIENNTGA
jgi:NADPH:quinone reductase-like Zn-dependent oxidoreductase